MAATYTVTSEAVLVDIGHRVQIIGRDHPIPVDVNSDCLDRLIERGLVTKVSAAAKVDSAPADEEPATDPGSAPASKK